MHLRVHTRIKPYHCKSCTYSCMHHSSIKEHLSKIHPNVVHTAATPAYVFNSVAVPDPTQFNSTDFDRAAFIAEAQESNDKLVAQINHHQQQKNSSPSILGSSLSSTSPMSNQSSPNMSMMLNDENTAPRISPPPPPPLRNGTSTKCTNFSISSLMAKSDSKTTTTPIRPPPQPMSQQLQHSNVNFTPAQLWTSANQMNLFYSYLYRMGQNSNY